MPTHLRDLDLNLLPLFEVIYRERNLTRASETLHLTQPAVSNALARLRAMQDRHALIHEVRGLGLHLGIELRRDGAPAADEADAAMYHSLSNGLSYKIGGGCVLTLCPPLTISRDELDRALDIVEAGIGSLD